MRVVFVGPPGAGKGTQAKIISNKFDISHISTGEILRKHLKESTELGKKAKSYMEKGELVPDSIIMDMIRALFQSGKIKKNGFLFDGFPRNIRQKKLLDHLLNEFNLSINKVLVLEVPDDIVIERLLKRAEKEGRTDDTRKIIKKRLQIYHKITKPIINSYKEEELVNFIDGIGTIEEITEKISDILINYK